VKNEPFLISLASNRLRHMASPCMRSCVKRNMWLIIIIDDVFDAEIIFAIPKSGQHRNIVVRIKIVVSPKVY
jgi:hypothetical protein